MTRRCRGTVWPVLCAVLSAWFATAGCGTSASPDHGAEILVFAASSLTDGLQDIKARYEAIRPHVTVRLNVGASGALRRQIEQGAAADLFISADGKNMQMLLDRR